MPGLPRTSHAEDAWGTSAGDGRGLGAGGSSSVGAARAVVFADQFHASLDPAAPARSDARLGIWADACCTEAIDGALLESMRGGIGEGGPSAGGDATGTGDGGLDPGGMGVGGLENGALGSGVVHPVSNGGLDRDSGDSKLVSVNTTALADGLATASTSSLSESTMELGSGMASSRSSRITMGRTSGIS